MVSGAGGDAEQSPSAGALGEGPDEKTARVHVIETIIDLTKKHKQDQNRACGSRRKWRRWAVGAGIAAGAVTLLMVVIGHTHQSQQLDPIRCIMKWK